MDQNQEPNAPVREELRVLYEQFAPSGYTTLIDELEQYILSKMTRSYFIGYTDGRNFSEDDATALRAVNNNL